MLVERYKMPDVRDDARRSLLRNRMAWKLELERFLRLRDWKTSLMDIEQIPFSVTLKNISNFYANKHDTPFYEKQRTTLIRNITRHRDSRPRVAPRILEKKLTPEKTGKPKSPEKMYTYIHGRKTTRNYSQENDRDESR